MPSLSDFVEEEYKDEVELIRETGTLWKKFVYVFFVLAGAFAFSFFVGDPS